MRSTACLIWKISRKLDNIHIIFIYPNLTFSCSGAQLLGCRNINIESDTIIKSFKFLKINEIDCRYEKWFWEGIEPYVSFTKFLFNFEKKYEI